MTFCLKQYKIVKNVSIKWGVTMAATCPNCNKKLRFYEIKAECSNCGVSIPNYNWEKRLEEDNVNAEAKFQSFYKSLNRIAYSIWGTKLRIARIVLSFIPIIGYIVPWAYMKSDATSFGIDLLGIFTDGKSLLDIISSFFGNSSLFIQNMKYEGFSGPITFTMLSVLFMVLSLVFMVIAFFLIIFTFKHSKTKAMFIFDVLGVSSAVVSAILFKVAMSSASSFAGFNFGDMPVYNAVGGVSWGFFVALVLLLVATGINLAVAKAPAKSDDELESERVARAEAKEEKARQAEIRKQKEKEENEKRIAAEQAEKLAKAKANLEASKTKKNK